MEKAGFTLQPNVNIKSPIALISLNKYERSMFQSRNVPLLHILLTNGFRSVRNQLILCIYGKRLLLIYCW